MAITSANGSYQDFGYTGGVQSFTIPQNGIYKLECWGAGGKNPTQIGDGWSPANAAPGGYSVGYIILNAGTVLYIACGGSSNEAVGRMMGGWNGGGQCINDYGHLQSGNNAGGGGGATHIATRDGTLEQLGNASGLLIVAGGGGGAGGATASHANNEQYGGRYSSGAGGGPEGESCRGTGGGFELTPGTAGTQSGGAAFGKGVGTRAEPGGDYKTGGGGGGFFGGKGTTISGGAGGSGYIGGVPAFTSTAGEYYAPATTTGAGSAANAAGWARITYVKADTIPVIFNGTRLTKIIYNGVTVGSLIYNGTKLYMRRLMQRLRRKTCLT